jgi:hypothetical protein
VRAPTLVVVALLAFGAAGAGPCGGTDDDTPDGGAAGTDGGPPPVCECPAGGAVIAHLPLACLCAASQAGGFLCSRTIADVTAAATCSDGHSAYRNTGCGKVSYEPGGAFAGHVLIYKSQGGAPIGVFQAADAAFGPCGANGVRMYVYGEGLFAPDFPAATAADACSAVIGCALCGPSDDPAPRCQ